MKILSAPALLPVWFSLTGPYKVPHIRDQIGKAGHKSGPSPHDHSGYDPPADDRPQHEPRIQRKAGDRSQSHEELDVPGADHPEEKKNVGKSDDLKEKIRA